MKDKFDRDNGAKPPDNLQSHGRENVLKTKARSHVMVAYQASHARFAALFTKLAQRC